MLAVGVGNALRGDDGAGLEVIRALRAAGGVDGCELVAYDGDGSGLVELWSGARSVVVVDAVRSGVLPGTVSRLDASDTPVPAGVAWGSVHAIGVAGAIELGRALGRLPERMIVYGIEAERFELGTGCSDAVRAGVSRAAALVAAEVRALGRLTAPRQT